jgi:hypothetical protein
MALVRLCKNRRKCKLILITFELNDKLLPATLKKTEGAMNIGQYRDTGNIGHKTKGQ